MRSDRVGLTLIEVVVSILIFAIGALGLAASSASIARQISSSTLRARSGETARERSELSSGTHCSALSSGESTSRGIRSEWTFSGGQVTTLDHRVRRTDAHGLHSDRFLSAIPCD